MLCHATLHHVSLCFAPGPNCEFLPCEANNPCENGAVCVEELDRHHFPLGFRCHCRRGFTGPRCEINVDECSSSPCFHGFCYDGIKRKPKKMEKENPSLQDGTGGGSEALSKHTGMVSRLLIISQFQVIKVLWQWAYSTWWEDLWHHLLELD